MYLSRCPQQRLTTHHNFSCLFLLQVTFYLPCFFFIASSFPMSFGDDFLKVLLQNSISIDSILSFTIEKIVSLSLPFKTWWFGTFLLRFFSYRLINPFHTLWKTSFTITIRLAIYTFCRYFPDFCPFNSDVYNSKLKLSFLIFLVLYT